MITHIMFHIVGTLTNERRSMSTRNWPIFPIWIPSNDVSNASLLSTGIEDWPDVLLILGYDILTEETELLERVAATRIPTVIIVHKDEKDCLNALDLTSVSVVITLNDPFDWTAVESALWFSLPVILSKF